MSDQIDVNQAIKKINLFVSTLQDYQLPSGKKKKKKAWRITISYETIETDKLFQKHALSW